MRILSYAIGVDIGGTKIATVITNENLEIHYQFEIPLIKKICLKKYLEPLNK